jgi:hypothetical protein
MLILRWILSVLLLLLFAYASCLNASIAWVGGVLNRRAASMGPLLGGIAGSLGLIIIPVSGFKHWWWLPFWLDFGSLPLLLATAYWYLIVDRKKKT